MGVGTTETCHHNFLMVRSAVSRRVLEKENIGRVGNPDAAVADRDSRGDVQAIGEDRDFVGLAISRRILQDLDPITARPRLQPRIFETLGHPDSSLLVKRHGNRVDQIRFRGDQFDLKSLGNRHPLEGFLGREWRTGRLTLAVRNHLVLFLFILRHFIRIHLVLLGFLFRSRGGQGPWRRSIRRDDTGPDQRDPEQQLGKWNSVRASWSAAEVSRHGFDP